MSLLLRHHDERHQHRRARQRRLLLQKQAITTATIRRRRDDDTPAVLAVEAHRRLEDGEHSVVGPDEGGSGRDVTRPEGPKGHGNRDGAVLGAGAGRRGGGGGADEPVGGGRGVDPFVFNDQWLQVGEGGEVSQEG